MPARRGTRQGDTVVVVTDRDTSENSLYRFAIDEGIRSIQHQDAEASRIRDRIVNMIGLTAAASAFLVGAALESAERGLRFYGPLACGTALFLALLVLGWRILSPARSWAAKVSPKILVRDFASRAEGYELLAGFYEAAQDENEAVLEILRRRLRRALLLSGGVILSWIGLAWLVAG